MPSINSTKTGFVAFAEQLSAGTDKHLTGTAQVMLGGSSFTPAEITAKLQSLVKLRADVDAAKAATQATLAVEEANMPALRTFVTAYATFVRAAFHGTPGVLADFGLHPKARTPLTVEAKVTAAAKRASTRRARNTMGRKQRLAVKGTVTGVVLTPVVAPNAVAPTPSTPSIPTAPVAPAATSAPAAAPRAP